MLDDNSSTKKKCQEPKCILREFNNFRMKDHPFDDKTYQQFKDNVLSYWCYVKDATDELGLVACRIFGICVNAASVERLWSCMGFIQTNRRSRLKMPKALNMSKLRADITYQHRREPDDLFSTFFNTASTHDNTTMHNNAHSDTTSTQMTHDNTTLTQTIHSNTNIDSSDKTQNEHLGADNKDEDNEECDLPYISEAEFGEYLQEWVEMLDEEEEADIIEDQDDYIELDDIIHLAIDENAKWKLS
ncbi:4568_t:CDS:2, partial [Cetraspora pellucida]